jgi:hypothetical protein
VYERSRFRTWRRGEREGFYAELCSDAEPSINIVCNEVETIETPPPSQMT